MKKIMMLIFIVLAIAVLTKPDRQMHKTELKYECTQLMNRTISNRTSGFWEKAGLALGNIFGKTLIENVIDEMVEVDDFFFFSTASIRWNGKSSLVSIGAFGKVFLTHELENAIEDGAFQ